MKLEVQDVFDRRMQEISAQIKTAIQRAVPRKEAEELIRTQNQLAQDCADKKISEDEYVQKLKDMPDRSNVIDFRNLAEFSYWVRKLYPEAHAHHVLEHENAHMHQAIEHKLRGFYSLIFAKDTNGTIGAIPVVGFFHPSGTSAEDFRRVDEDVMSAPDTLSEFDREELRKLRGTKDTS